MKQLINDGYELDAEIPPQNGYDGFSIRYRPALPEAVFDYYEKMGRSQTGKEKIKIAIDLFKTYIRSWTIIDDKDVGLPVSEENIRKLPHCHYNILVDLITGYRSWNADAKN